MKNLHNLGLRGRLPGFLSNFLFERNFKVHAGSTLTDLYNEDKGIPLETIYALILFSIKINSIIKCFNSGIDSDLYVDDLTFRYTTKYILTTKRQLQMKVDQINRWATNNIFWFSKSNPQCVHFYSLWKMHKNPSI